MVESIGDTAGTAGAAEGGAASVSQFRQAPSISLTNNNFEDKTVLKCMSMSKIYESRRTREQEIKQLHTRIQYLQNEELRKLKKIDESRKHATKMFENQLESKKIQLSVKKQRDWEANQRRLYT